MKKCFFYLHSVAVMIHLVRTQEGGGRNDYNNNNNINKKNRCLTK